MTFDEDLERVLAMAHGPERTRRAELLAREADKQLTEIREQQESRDAEKDADHPRRREKK